MVDFSGGHISTAESAQLLASLQERMEGKGVRFHAGRLLPAPDGLARRDRHGGEHPAPRHHGERARNTSRKARGRSCSLRSWKRPARSSPTTR
jgi:hypothetical protein